MDAHKSKLIISFSGFEDEFVWRIEKSEMSLRHQIDYESPYCLKEDTKNYAI